MPLVDKEKFKLVSIYSLTLLIITLTFFTFSKQVIFLDGGRILYNFLSTGEYAIDSPHWRYSNLLIQGPLLLFTQIFPKTFIAKQLLHLVGSIYSFYIILSFIFSLLLIKKYRSHQSIYDLLFFYGAITLLSLGFPFSYALEASFFIFPFYLVCSNEKSIKILNISSFLICLYLAFSYETSILYLIAFCIMDFIKNRFSIRTIIYLLACTWLSWLILFHIDGPNKYPFFSSISAFWDIFTAFFFMMLLVEVLLPSIPKLAYKVIICLSSIYIIYIIITGDILFFDSFHHRAWMAPNTFLLFTIIWLREKKLKTTYSYSAPITFAIACLLSIKLSSQWIHETNKFISKHDNLKGCHMIPIDILNKKFKRLGFAYNNIAEHSILLQGKMSPDYILFTSSEEELSQNNIISRCNKNDSNSFLNIDLKNYFIDINKEWFYDLSLLRKAM